MKKQKFRLTHAALVSTTLVSLPLHAGVISTVVTTQQQTSVVGNIQITPTGQINVVNTDAVLMDSPSALVTLDPNNKNIDAILTSGALGLAINVTGSNANISVGAGTGINSTNDDGILIKAPNAIITNAGSIVAKFETMRFNTGGDNATINNLQGGLILSKISSGIAVNALGSSIYNAGTITATDNIGVLAVAYFRDFNTLTNYAQGKIIGPNFSDTIRTLNPITGDIQNYGLISGSNGPWVIGIFGYFTGTITNNLGGIIQGTNTSGIDLFTDFNPSGGITAINNAGIITIDNGVAIVAGENNITVTQGITNTGTISNTAPGGAAIDLQSAGNNISAHLFQIAGLIHGDVFLASAGGEVLTLSGGTIEGDVIAAGTAPDILTITGGRITGTTTLGNAGDTVNFTGGSLQALIGGTGADTINITGSPFGFPGPTLTSLDGGGGAGVDTLNILSTFLMDGPISRIGIINVLNGTFTAQDSITELDTQLNIMPGARMISNSTISGTGLLLNQGTLQLNANSSVNLGSYVQNGGALLVEIQGPATFGRITTTGASNVFSKTIQPIFSPTEFIPNNTTFDIITAGLPVQDFTTLVQIPFPIIFFTKEDNVGGNNVQLTLHRNPYQSAALTDNAFAVATTLDNLVPPFVPSSVNSDLLALFTQLDVAPTAAVLTSYLEQLVPFANYSLVGNAFASMAAAFDMTLVRMENMRKVAGSNKEFQGFNAGDPREKATRSWAKVYAQNLDQQRRQHIDGYETDLAGVELGYDWGIVGCAAFGVAGSYSTERATDKAPTRNKAKTYSYQATLYGWYEPFDAVYIDAMLGLALHHYYTNRNIDIGNIHKVSTSVFNAEHLGAQFEAGYAFLVCDEYYVAPIARFKYTYLHFQDIMESGAGGLSLAINNDAVNEAILGVGLRIARDWETPYGRYVPEFSALYLYDFAGEPLGSVSSFVGGGIPFATTSLVPGQKIYLLGFSLDSYIVHKYNFTIKYNLELRDAFVGNEAYFLLRRAWG